MTTIAYFLSILMYKGMPGMAGIQNQGRKGVTQ